MIKEDMNIGYIRSNCLSKISHLFEGKSITQFVIARSRQEKKKMATPYSWENIQASGLRTYQINWNMWKKHSSWPIVIKRLGEQKTKFQFKDFVVEKIEVRYDDPELVSLVNHKIAWWEDKQGLSKKSEPLSSDTQLYITYANSPLAYTNLDGWSADTVKMLNLGAVKLLGFKNGVLDIKHIATVQKRRYNQFEDLDILIHNEYIIRRILKHLKTDRWFQLPEVRETIDKETGENPYPGAFRTYTWKQGFGKWAFVKDTEIKS